MAWNSNMERFHSYAIMATNKNSSSNVANKYTKLASNSFKTTNSTIRRRWQQPLNRSNCWNCTCINNALCKFWVVLCDITDCADCNLLKRKFWFLNCCN